MKKKVAVLFIIVFLFSGCTYTDILKNTDDLLGDSIMEEKPTNNIKAVTTYKNLTKEQKSIIDSWLEKNGYNRYGDSAGVIYAGGTPLFDESSGTTKDRYEYVLERHPGLIDILNNY